MGDLFATLYKAVVDFQTEKMMIEVTPDFMRRLREEQKSVTDIKHINGVKVVVNDAVSVEAALHVDPIHQTFEERSSIPALSFPLTEKLIAAYPELEGKLRQFDLFMKMFRDKGIKDFMLSQFTDRGTVRCSWKDAQFIVDLYVQGGVLQLNHVIECPRHHTELEDGYCIQCDKKYSGKGDNVRILYAFK